MSSQQPYTAFRDGNNPGEYGVVRLIHGQAATQHGGSAEFASDNCARAIGLHGTAARKPGLRPEHHPF